MDLDRVQEWQKRALWILYAAMGLKIVGEWVPMLNFASGVLLAVFFVAEMFLLPPVGVAIMSVLTGVLFFFLPSAVGFLLGMMVGSVLLIAVAGVICAFCSGIVMTFIGGWLASVEVIIVTAPLSIAAGVAGGTAALGAGAALGTKAAIDAASLSAGSRKGRAALMFLANVLVMLLVAWPVLSYTGAINGALACKPAVIAGQALLNHLNVGNTAYKEVFTDEKEWPFESQYYHEIIRGTNNNIAQGKTNLIAGNDDALALVLDGLLYVHDADIEDTIATGAYFAREGDALVLDGFVAYVFGRDKIYVCGKQGHYTWKKTSYVSDFEKLPWEEKCERLYALLEKQNTEEKRRFSPEEVGLLARAQHSGLLLNYNRNTHEAIFTYEEKGRVYYVLQRAPGMRHEQGSFVAQEDTLGLPFVKIGSEGIMYLDESRVKFMAEFEGWKSYVPFTHPEGGSFRTMNFGWVNGDYDQRYTAYLGWNDRLYVDLRNIGQTTVKPFTLGEGENRLVGFAGDRLYVLQYPKGLFSWLTYIPDLMRAAQVQEDNAESSFRADRVWTQWKRWRVIQLDRDTLLAQ